MYVFLQKNLFTFVLLLSKVFCIENNSHSNASVRLLGATQVTREQITRNFQGSASIALGYRNNIGQGYFSVLIAPDTVICLFDVEFVQVRTTALKRLLPADPADGESYTSSPHEPVPDRPFYTAKFGPVPSNSKGVPAILPPAGSSPPQPGTTDCIVYSYGSNLLPPDNGDEHGYLAYSSLKIIEPSVCHTELDMDMDENQFCGSVVSPGGFPICSKFDTGIAVLCPQKNMKGYSAEGRNGKIYCVKWGYWWFWCPEEEELTEVQADEPWMLVGLSSINHNSGDCGSEKESVIAFEYTYEF